MLRRSRRLRRAGLTGALLMASSGALLGLEARAGATAAPSSVLTPGADPAVAPDGAGSAASGPPAAKAWLLADADTGAVLADSQAHLPLRPASVAKILTAYVALRSLPPDAVLSVGADAAGEEAMKINMKVGQVWSLDQAMHALLMVSANDAAIALADRVSGSPQAFGQRAQAEALQLGARDPMLFDDPTGLDDSFSLGQGDYMSAYDLAVITRAAMAIPEFRDIVALHRYEFVGGDGASHVLRNHDHLLQKDPTAIGVKPGYTRQAGETLVAEAQRDGRTMLVVLLGDTPASLYDDAEALMTRGFATPVADEQPLEQLPAPRLGADLAPNRLSPRSVLTPAVPAARHAGAGTRDILILAVGLAGAFFARRRQVSRRRTLRFG